MKRLKRLALVIFFGAKCFGAATALAAPASDCPSLFADLDRKNAELGKRAAVFSNDVRTQVRHEGKELDALIRKKLRDLKTPTSAAVRPTVDLGSDAVKKASEILRLAQTDLDRQGFKTTIEKRPPFTHFDPVSQAYVQVGEREVLRIEGGASRSPFAREVHAYETYATERMSDSKFPETLRNIKLGVQLDPLLNSISRSHGVSLNPTSPMGRGINLSPELLVTSADDAVEMLRHEKRHLKVYFDVLTGRPTPYRGRLVDLEDRGLLEAKDNSWAVAYDSYYSFDEMIGFMSNVKSSQARLGKITEAFSKKQSRTDDAALVSDYRVYKKSVSEIRDEGLLKSKKVERFAQSTIENMKTTQSVLENGTLLEFNDRTVIQVPADYPGLLEVSIWLGPETRGRRFVVLVPEAVVKKGLPATRDFAIKSAKEIESEAEKNLAEIRLRTNDLLRDSIERLKPGRAN